MLFKLTHSEFEHAKGEGTRQLMKGVVESGEVPGILAYAGDVPIGWCAVEPRENYPRLSRSRILRKIDDEPVWSIVCFFVDRQFRKQGVSVKLLEAAVEYVRKQGGEIIEGYAVEPKKSRMPDAFAFSGLESAYSEAGFVECARRSETRPIMRYYLSG